MEDIHQIAIKWTELFFSDLCKQMKNFYGGNTEAFRWIMRKINREGMIKDDMEFDNYYGKEEKKAKVNFLLDKVIPEAYDIA